MRLGEEMVRHQILKLWGLWKSMFLSKPFESLAILDSEGCSSGGFRMEIYSPDVPKTLHPNHLTS